MRYAVRGEKREGIRSERKKIESERGHIKVKYQGYVVYHHAKSMTYRDTAYLNI